MSCDDVIIVQWCQQAGVFGRTVSSDMRVVLALVSTFYSCTLLGILWKEICPCSNGCAELYDYEVEQTPQLKKFDTND